MPTRTFFVNGQVVSDPRSTRQWRQLRDRVISEEPLCWLALDGCTRVSTTGDHVIPVTERADLALVRSNVRGACRSCNDRRGNLPVSALHLEPTPAALSVFG